MKFNKFFGLFIALALFIALYLIHNWGRMDGIDAHIFSSIGLHLLDGKVMYSSVWESKPINIYLLNAMALKVFGVGHHSMWIVQIINGLASCSLVFLLIIKWTKDQHIAFLASVFFMWLFYFSGLYYSGNCTEEFGVSLLLFGIYSVLKAVESSSSKWFFISGISFASAMWFKEPFLFSIVPWLTYALVYFIKKKDLKNLMMISLGFLSPFIIYGSYFLIMGTLDDFIKVFIYNRAYTQYEAMTFAQKIAKGWKYYFEYFQINGNMMVYLPLISIPAMLLVRKQSMQLVLLLILVLELVLEFFSISLSGLAVTHYYLQMIPTFTLLLAYSFWLISHRVKFRYFLIVKGIVLGVVLNLVFNISLPKSPDMTEYDAIVSYLEKVKESDDKIFVESAWHGHLYVTLNMTSDVLFPNPLFHYFMIQDKYNNERVRKFVLSLKSAPPKYIIQSKEIGILINHSELKQWFYERYGLIKEFPFSGSDEKLRLYKINQP